LQFRDNAAAMPTAPPDPRPPSRPARAEVVVVGAGIIGLATALALLHAGHEVTVLDKEAQVGHHQSGHNSGVVHAGLYYRPGSIKARLCREGREQLETYCAGRGIPFSRCGKVVVACSVAELDALSELRDRGHRNGLEIELLDRRGLADHEPHVDGVAALFVPATGVVDFAEVCRAFAADVVEAGGRVELGRAVTAIDERPGAVHVGTSDGALVASRLVNCGGLHADRLARLAGAATDVSIVPFRGEYYELAPPSAALVRHLVYPVPDPRFPFLGVHLSRGVDGRVHVGPNAVLALAREGYDWSRVDRTDVGELARDRRVWKLARRHWRTGVGEVTRSASRHLMTRAARRLVPGIRSEDLRAAGAGVRAQAVDVEGTLVDDFAIVETGRMVHVLNAPSPGATASLALGRWIADRVEGVPTETG
jgi:L-2-hydroxyglutarate oxidase LhgO